MRLILTLALAAAALVGSSQTTVRLADYGIRPGQKADMAPRMERALAKIAAKTGKKDVTLLMEPGDYNFYNDKAPRREYYISNHDQDNPKPVGICLEGWEGLTLTTPEGAEGRINVLCHGRMLPLAVKECSNTTIRHMDVDFVNPMMTQLTVVANSPESGLTFRPAPWVKMTIHKSGRLSAYGHGWEQYTMSAMVFDSISGHILPRTTDIVCAFDSIVREPGGLLRAPKFYNPVLKPGNKMAMRTYMRPYPGVFLAENVATTLIDVRIHYAEGMGLLAQLCDGITLDGCGVCRRGDDDPRFFTSQADATHFSGCKGVIDSRNGLYENMMDDAINVHGTYLKVVGREADNVLIGRYMHGQSYGFKWGDPGDTVQFIASRTMELIGDKAVIKAIEPVDKPTVAGAKVMRITFDRPVDPAISETGAYGMENLEWCPEVRFTGNTVRNNRARGALFSTPRTVTCTDNLFDHVSGSGILLCGDCNGWYETGACRRVIISRNRFVNCLMSVYQFTEAVISIYPEIPDLAGQRLYFHGGQPDAIEVTDNEFVMFDRPVLYAKSVDGLRFSGNRVVHSSEYPAFHHNPFTYKFERARRVVIENNTVELPGGVSIDLE